MKNAKGRQNHHCAVVVFSADRRIRAVPKLSANATVVERKVTMSNGNQSGLGAPFLPASTAPWLAGIGVFAVAATQVFPPYTIAGKVAGLLALLAGSLANLSAGWRRN